MKLNPDAQVVSIDRKRGYTLFCELEATAEKSWLVRNLLGDGEASAVYGKPGAAKSALVEDMALHIAAGMEWHGRAVKHGAVLYVAIERPGLVARRAIAFRQKHGVTDAAFAFTKKVHSFLDPQQISEVLKMIRDMESDFGKPVVLIVVDTLSRALNGGDENSSVDMGKIVAATTRIQKETKAHLLWVHHMPQDAERMRGHGALLGAMDTTILVEKLSSGDRKATVVKANDSEEGDHVAFTLESVEIGHETSAPVVVPLDPAAILQASQTKRRISERCQLAVTALAETVLRHGVPAPAKLQLALGTKVVEIDQWRDELHSRNVIDRGSANPRADFRRILEQLAVRNLVGSKEQFVWLASV